MSSARLAVVALIPSLFASLPAHAIEFNGEPIRLFGGGLYELEDSARDSKEGRGLLFGVGLPLAGREGEVVEFTVKALRRDRRLDGEPDYQQALFGNWVRDFGALGAGAQPYTLLGAGVVREDVRGDDHFHPGLEGGIGARFPLPVAGWGIRTEAVAQAQLNDDSVPGEDFLLDFHLRVALQFGAGERAVSALAVSETAPECPGARSVNPVTGAASCVADSDGDGVADDNDQCPGTLSGSAVDAQGCAVAGPVDSDGDGVLDAADACPSTTVGMVVDGTGCLVEQTVTLKAVNFETNSARLTPDARIALDEVARTLKNQSNLVVEIVGHTDDVGNDGFNLLLSQERAQSVRQYLIGKGVAPDRLSATGLGETAPVADNASESGREANRRVEFKVSVK